MPKILVTSLAVLLAGALFLSPCSALDGVPYISLTIEGKTYSVPIPNPKVEEDFYMLKKATKGDEDAREILLGGKEERWFYIGDVGIVRWCHITKDKITVKECK